MATKKTTRKAAKKKTTTSSARASKKKRIKRPAVKTTKSKTKKNPSRPESEWTKRLPKTVVRLLALNAINNAIITSNSKNEFVKRVANFLRTLDKREVLSIPDPIHAELEAQVNRELDRLWDERNKLERKIKEKWPKMYQAIP